MELEGALGAFAAVPNDHARDRLGRAQVNLPPGLVLLLSMESWTSIFHPITATGGIITWLEGHVVGGSQTFFIGQPVGFNQLPPGRRVGGRGVGGQGAKRERESQRE